MIFCSCFLNNQQSISSRACKCGAGENSDDFRTNRRQVLQGSCENQVHRPVVHTGSQLYNDISL